MRVDGGKRGSIRINVCSTVREGDGILVSLYGPRIINRRASASLVFTARITFLCPVACARNALTSRGEII